MVNSGGCWVSLLLVVWALLHIVSECLHIALYVCFDACGFVVDAGCLCLLWCRLPGEGVGLFNSA